MKDRFTLAVLIILLWVFLFIFHKYTPVQSSIFILLGFMMLYVFLIQAAQYHQKRKYKKKPKELDTSYKPFITIVIPAHNEEFVIKDTIANMLAVDYPLYEIIIVDDRSTDSTAKVLKEIADEYPDKFRFYTRDKNSFPGKSAVLNEALDLSKGDVICVFDADARIDANFLTKIIPHLAEPDVGAVQARKIINNHEFNLLTRCQNNEYCLDAHFQRGRDTIKGAVELRGNGQLIKKEALKDVEGWNNHTITDDLDLSTRLHLKGWDIRFCIDVFVYEEGVTSFFPLLRQRRRWLEGSIRRYLDYFTEVLTSKTVSLRVGLDMLAYISEFVLPIWLVSEWAINGINFVRGTNNHFLSSVAVLPLICLFFISCLIYSLRKYHKYGLLKAIVQAIETGTYMVFIWTPVASYIIIKIIFMKRGLDWGKTEHGVQEKDKNKVTQEGTETHNY